MRDLPRKGIPAVFSLLPLGQAANGRHAVHKKILEPRAGLAILPGVYSRIDGSTLLVKCTFCLLDLLLQRRDGVL